MICNDELLNHFDEYELVHKVALNIHYLVIEHFILFDEQPISHQSSSFVHDM